jgi:hypothetical protein
VAILQAAVHADIILPFQKCKSVIQCSIMLTESNSLSATPDNIPGDTEHSAQ